MWSDDVRFCALEEEAGQPGDDDDDDDWQVTFSDRVRNWCLAPVNSPREEFEMSTDGLSL